MTAQSPDTIRLAGARVALTTDEIDKSFLLCTGMLVVHGRPRGKERGGGWKPRRAAGSG